MLSEQWQGVDHPPYVAVARHPVYRRRALLGLPRSRYDGQIEMLSWALWLADLEQELAAFKARRRNGGTPPHDA